MVGPALVGPPIGWRKRDRVKDNCLAAKKREEERGGRRERYRDVERTTCYKGCRSPGELIFDHACAPMVKYIPLIFIIFFFFFLSSKLSSRFPPFLLSYATPRFALVMRLVRVYGLRDK